QRSTVVRPSPRFHFAMAYDASRKRCVLFGGALWGTPNSRADTWEWDGTQWLQVTPVSGGPPARRDHAMTYDSVRRRVLLFGGSDAGSTLFDDLWSWDGSVWTRLPSTNRPTPRQEHAFSFDAARD